MKIVRYFIASQSEDTGMNGFLPLWIPGASTFDPSGSTGMVHDMLEHRLCDQGHFHEELMAFGRVIALRVATYFTGSSGRGPTGEGMGAEIGGVWADITESGDTFWIPHAPKTKPITGHDRVEQTIQDIAAQAMETAAREVHNRNGYGSGRPTARLHSAMVGWMRVGYLDAVRRYGGTDHGCYDVGHSAFGWANQSKTVNTIDALYDEHAETNSMVLRLCYDTKRHRMAMTEIEVSDTGWPQWLAIRIARWRGGRIRPVPFPAFETA